MNKKNKITKRNIYIIILIITILFLISIISINNFINKQIVCEQVINDKNGIVENNNIKFNLTNKNIKKISYIKEITIDKKYGQEYYKMVESTLNKTYKDLKLNYNIKRKNNKIIVEVMYEDKGKYILNNVDLYLDDEGVKINVVSEDNNDSYGKIDFSKKYSINDIEKEFSKLGYTCK